jgi:putrescine transport system substrate-binding protein
MPLDAETRLPSEEGALVMTATALSHRRTSIAAACMLAAMPRPSWAEGKELNVCNWSDYIGETTVADFQKETGIAVRYDVYDSNQTLEAKLMAGNAGYDMRLAAPGAAARGTSVSR